MYTMYTQQQKKGIMCVKEKDFWLVVNWADNTNKENWLAYRHELDFLETESNSGEKLLSYPTSVDFCHVNFAPWIVNSSSSNPGKKFREKSFFYPPPLLLLTSIIKKKTSLRVKIGFGFEGHDDGERARVRCVAVGTVVKVQIWKLKMECYLSHREWNMKSYFKQNFSFFFGWNDSIGSGNDYNV